MRTGKRLYHAHCAYLRYSGAYEKRVATEGGERTAIYKALMARKGKAKRMRRDIGVRMAFGQLLPGRRNANPRKEPWSLGWLERLYDLEPELMRGSTAPRHAPMHSLAVQRMPELRALPYPMVNSLNPFGGRSA